MYRPEIGHFSVLYFTNPEDRANLGPNEKISLPGPHHLTLASGFVGERERAQLALEDASQYLFPTELYVDGMPFNPERRFDVSMIAVKPANVVRMVNRVISEKFRQYGVFPHNHAGKKYKPHITFDGSHPGPLRQESFLLDQMTLVQLVEPRVSEVVSNLRLGE